MPEPYPFPKVPEQFSNIRFLDKRMQPIALEYTGAPPLIATPPISETNHVGFFFSGETEVFRWALIVNDAGEVVPITEDGKVAAMDDLLKLAFKIAMGTEAYEAAGMEKIIEGKRPAL